LLYLAWNKNVSIDARSRRCERALAVRWRRPKKARGRGERERREEREERKRQAAAAAATGNKKVHHLASRVCARCVPVCGGG
jgi:hypothetical protein